MKNSILNLGKVLEKTEQEKINAGRANETLELAGCFPQYGCFEEI